MQNIPGKTTISAPNVKIILYFIGKEQY